MFYLFHKGTEHKIKTNETRAKVSVKSKSGSSGSLTTPTVLEPELLPYSKKVMGLIPESDEERFCVQCVGSPHVCVDLWFLSPGQTQVTYLLSKLASQNAAFFFYSCKLCGVCGVKVG